MAYESIHSRGIRAVTTSELEKRPPLCPSSMSLTVLSLIFQSGTFTLLSALVPLHTSLQWTKRMCLDIGRLMLSCVFVESQTLRIHLIKTNLIDTLIIAWMDIFTSIKLIENKNINEI